MLTQFYKILFFSLDKTLFVLLRYPHRVFTRTAVSSTTQSDRRCVTDSLVTFFVPRHRSRQAW
jgi:hypothetical protein